MTGRHLGHLLKQTTADVQLWRRLWPGCWGQPQPTPQAPAEQVHPQPAVPLPKEAHAPLLPTGARLPAGGPTWPGEF
jgi:hypothetical protein